jgi:hypothetical protein
MSKKIKLKALETPYEFELDDNGFVWLLDYELKGTKTNLGQTEGGVKNLEKAEQIAIQMISSMGLLE